MLGQSSTIGSSNFARAAAKSPLPNRTTHVNQVTPLPPTLYSKGGKKGVARRSVVSDGLKFILGAVVGALVVLLLVGSFSGGMATA